MDLSEEVMEVAQAEENYRQVIKRKVRVLKDEQAARHRLTLARAAMRDKHYELMAS